MSGAPLAFVEGAGGVRLAVRTAGDAANPPVVLLHGWASASTTWSHQLADTELTSSFRLIAADLRGHGQSDVPDAGYGDPAAWAADLAAVLELAGPGPAVLVGSSYGGVVITDYLRVLGDDRLAGVVLVGAPTELGPGHPGGAVGPAMATSMRPALSEDPAVAVPALTELIAAMTAAPVSGELVQRWLGDALRVPPRVRAALFRRDVDSAGVLASVSVPALVVHGTADVVVDPTAAEYAAGKIPGASLRWFYDVGHLPFVERVEEFNRTLREFAGQCHAAAG